MHALTEGAGLKENDIKIVEELALRPGVVQVFVARDPEPTLAALVEQAILGARAAGIRFEHNLAVALPVTATDTLSAIDQRDEGETDEAPPGSGFQLPIAADVTVFPANPRLAGPEKTNLEAAVKAALVAYVEASAIGGVLVYNRMVADLLGIAGVLDVVLLATPKAGTGDKGKRNLLVPAGRRATLAEADVTRSVRGRAGAVRLSREGDAEGTGHRRRRPERDQGTAGGALRQAADGNQHRVSDGGTRGQ